MQLLVLVLVGCAAPCRGFHEEQVVDIAFLGAGPPLDESVGLNKVLLESAVGFHQLYESGVLIELFHEVVPDRGTTYGSRYFCHLGIVVIAYPHAYCEVGCVAYRPTVAVVVGGTGFDRCREANFESTVRTEGGGARPVI